MLSGVCWTFTHPFIHSRHAVSRHRRRWVFESLRCRPTTADGFTAQR